MPAEKALYFIAIVPPEPIQGELFLLKKQLAEAYNSRGALKSPPHITLHMPFHFRPDREQKLIDALNQAVRPLPAFKITIDAYDVFPPRVIFIDVEENEQLRSLQAIVQKAMKEKLNIFNARYRDQPFHPHLTMLFRDLRKSEFHRAWEKLRTEEVKYDWKVNEVCLLKHTGTQWEIHHRLTLETAG
jgi:2'-5' RNA ligase